MVAGIVVVLLLATGILALAMFITRQQKMLQEKQALYLNYKKQLQLHQSQYNRFKKEADKQKISCAVLIRDRDGFSATLTEKKKYIREMAALIRDEQAEAENSSNDDLLKMVHRRKLLIRKVWGELNALKLLYNQKKAEARVKEQKLADLIAQRDKELTLFHLAENKYSTAKKEVEKLRKNMTDKVMC